MQSNPLIKAFVLAFILIIGFIGCWEYYWRSKGFTATQNDDKVLWASKRKEIYVAESSTVFIGGSRIKFDLDIPTWQQLTGEKAIQLALVGTPARQILRDLANDKNFKGKLIIDVTEFQFFSLDTLRRETNATEALAYYHNETPAQKASAYINYALESKIVFLEEGKYSLNMLLQELPIPPRPEVFVFPVFPKDFGMTNANRQTYMTEKFLTDPQLQNTQADIWKKLMIGGMSRAPSLQGPPLEFLLKQIKTFIDKIRSRGGQVMFVRPPSSGLLLATERKTYPRAKYWDHLLKYTNTPGIHFENYPTITNFVCPEMSHLSSVDAITFTKHLAAILQNEKGWSFPQSAVIKNEKP